MMCVVEWTINKIAYVTGVTVLDDTGGDNPLIVIMAAAAYGWWDWFPPLGMHYLHYYLEMHEQLKKKIQQKLTD